MSYGPKIKSEELLKQAEKRKAESEKEEGESRKFKAARLVFTHGYFLPYRSSEYDIRIKHYLYQ